MLEDSGSGRLTVGLAINVNGEGLRNRDPPPSDTQLCCEAPPKARAPTGPLCSETRAREAQTATRSLDDPLLPADPVKARGGPRRKPETGTLDAPSLQGRTNTSRQYTSLTRP